MKTRWLPLVLLTFLASVPASAQDLLGFFNAQLDIERELLADDLRLYAAARETQNAEMELLRGALDAVDQTLEARDVTLGELERLEVNVVQREEAYAIAQRRADELRGRIRDRLRQMAALEDRVDLLQSAPGVRLDPLSGRWRLETDPGVGQEDERVWLVDLQLNGTLVTGSYTTEDDGSGGSLRGTLIGDQLRLERVDSRLGFDSIWIGTLDAARREIRGTWIATNLSAGGPASGTWEAQKIENPAEEPREPTP